MSQTLTNRTIEALKNYISENKLKPGEKLPTLHELAEQFSVSRTIIREAVIALRTEGHLISRHGVGVFISEKSPLQPAYSEEISSLAPLTQMKASTIDLLELRLAFEVHAAGLAARRHTWAQEAKIWEIHQNFQKSLDNKEKLDQLDLAFHQSIAEATNNNAFLEFFQLMSLRIIPQPAFSEKLFPDLITRDYIQMTIDEHQSICEAISAQNNEAAKKAMHAHLTRSHRRYSQTQLTELK
ncbi:FadR/GntR family transcriptional regulator [Falsochrobactrum ovis]|uniref:GntR family transcriptional regulator n=1 Tax=Falsochrobactrum ovis TaxID=1293442 RepID=A0A364JSF6_9HYPH|nr:FadR/GntR family transcriptional regulator [Falsochrobactrum ovis]RAK26090.1 GntR family transcriptional regulator [Falsochrobactrum ovis]